MSSIGITDLKNPAVLVATWFGLGLLPYLPGLFGSIGALPFGYAIIQYGGINALLQATVIMSVIGWWAADKVGRQTGVADNQIIVVDEVVGQWIALLAAVPLTPRSVLLALLLFRAFDVTKLGPVGWAEKRLPGAYGVMADDIVAGLCALLCLIGLRYAGLG